MGVTGFPEGLEATMAALGTTLTISRLGEYWFLIKVDKGRGSPLSS